MSLSDSQNHSLKKNRKTYEVFDSVFDFLMDFACRAETIVPQPKRRTVKAAEAPDDEEEPSEDRSDGDAGELFDKLPVRVKEELLKEVFGEIVRNMLDNLPKDGKEAFLARCFHSLFPKLPSESRRVIKIKVKDVPSQFQEDFPARSAPGLTLPFSCRPVGTPSKECILKYPGNVGNPRPTRYGRRPGPTAPWR